MDNTVTDGACWCETPPDMREPGEHDFVCNEMLARQEQIDLFRRSSTRWKKLAKKYRMNQVDICPNCGRGCDPTTCWCGDDHRKSYGDGGHSHIPMGCVCGYAEDVARDQHVLKKMLFEARMELTLLKNGIYRCEPIFCSDPNCSTNNPRT
jgi:hypothetical protein